MKIVEGDSVVVIYPFLLEDSEPWVTNEKITVWPNGNIEIFLQSSWIGLSAENARKMAEALLHAVELAGMGRGEGLTIYPFCCIL